MNTHIDDHIIILAGQVHAILCCECNTDFPEFMLPNPVWLKKVDLDATKEHFLSRGHAGKPASKLEWRQLVRDQNAVEIELHAISLEWLKTSYSGEEK